MNYKRTIASCMVAIFTQAIVVNLVALLFTPFMALYELTYAHLGILVCINFATQVSADIIFSGLIDRIGFKKLIFPTCALTFVGFVLLGCVPWVFPQHIFAGLVISTVLFAFAGGMMEVLISPMVDAIPTDDKNAAMSLTHSFYAWGQIATIIITTLFVFLFGGKNWQIIVFIWALMPLANFFMYLMSPIPDVLPAEKRDPAKSVLKNVFYILALAAIFFGAGSEITLNQWTSTFMEKGLGLSKVMGDLIGMTGYAFMLGFGRTLHAKIGNRIDISKLLIAGSGLSLVCYLIVALSASPIINIAACILCGFGTSLLWPGTIELSSERFPMAGAWMFAVLAVAGDIGGSLSSWITGEIVDFTMTTNFAVKLANFLGSTVEQASIRTGILCAAVFPLCACVIHYILRHMRKAKQNTVK